MPNRRGKIMKYQERYFLEQFLERLGQAGVIVEEREAPDFLVRFPDGLVGVELTQLFTSGDTQGSSPQAWEAISDVVMAKAASLYAQAGGRWVDVKAVFAPHRSLRDLDRDETAPSLCNWVLGFVLEPWQVKEWRPAEVTIPLPSEITYVCVTGMPTPTMGRWTVARAGWVYPLLVTELQKRVDEKTLRLSRFQGAAAKHWLIIVADAMKPSSLIEARADFDPTSVLSPFHRTFFYRHPDSIVELGPS